MKNFLLIGLIALFTTTTFAQMKDKTGESLLCGYSYFESKNSAKPKNDDLDPEPFMRFWRKVNSYTREQTIDLNRIYQINLKSDFPTGKLSDGDISFAMNSAQPEFHELLKDFTVAIDESNLLKILALEKMNEKIIGADLQLNYGETDVEFNLELKTNSENTAERATTRLKMLFAVTSSFFKNNTAEEFYKNAEISANKEKIFIKSKMAKVNLIKYLQRI